MHQNSNADSGLGKCFHSIPVIIENAGISSVIHICPLERLQIETSPPVINKSNSPNPVVL
jgi:hypothetical protein